MKNRRPRKLKKLAKRCKAAADAALTMQASLITAMGMTQVAIVNCKPIPFSNPMFIHEKTLAIAQITIDTANGIQKCLSGIKPWQYYATHH